MVRCKHFLPQLFECTAVEKCCREIGELTWNISITAQYRSVERTKSSFAATPGNKSHYKSWTNEARDSGLYTTISKYSAQRFSILSFSTTYETIPSETKKLKNSLRMFINPRKWYLGTTGMREHLSCCQRYADYKGFNSA